MVKIRLSGGALNLAKLLAAYKEEGKERWSIEELYRKIELVGVTTKKTKKKNIQTLRQAGILVPVEGSGSWFEVTDKIDNYVSPDEVVL